MSIGLLFRGCCTPLFIRFQHGAMYTKAGKMMSHMSSVIRLRSVSLMLQCFSGIGMDPDIGMAYPGQQHAKEAMLYKTS